MTTKRSAYNSRLYRDVNDAPALAVLVAFSIADHAAGVAVHNLRV